MLSPTYIPIVSIYKENGNSSLKKYTIKRTSGKLDLKVVTNAVIKEAIDYLGENTINFEIIENDSTMTYYYLEKSNKFMEKFNK